MFIDESGFLLQPLARRTWAERGQTPVLEQWDRRNRVSVITALALTPKCRRVRMFFQLLDHNAKGEDFLWFLVNLRNELRRKLHVVWDNLGAHRKTENFLHTIGCAWVRFHRFPPYAPELNPVEHVWSTAKWGHLANAPPESLERMHANVHQALAHQADEQRLLRGHFRWAGLDLQ